VPTELRDVEAGKSIWTEQWRLHDHLITGCLTHLVKLGHMLLRPVRQQLACCHFNKL